MKEVNRKLKTVILPSCLSVCDKITETIEKYMSMIFTLAFTSEKNVPLHVNYIST